MHENQAVSDGADISQVRTAAEFGKMLTAVRKRAGLTVRQAARIAGIPAATAGDYFSGAHLPPTTAEKALVDILRACGITDPNDIGQWLAALARARRTPGRAAAGDPAPYRGLEGYQPEHAAWFHGRAGLTAELVDRLRPLRQAGRGALVVVGPSGSGKSSVLRAGLIPALRAERDPAPAIVLLTPGPRPLKTLRELLAAPADPPGELVVVVDQFEEVFTTCTDDRQRQAFLDGLRAMAEATATPQWPAAIVVLGLRADYYEHALRYPQLAEVAGRHQVVVAPMTQDELREAIVEPARQGKVDIEDGLVELLLSEIAPGGTGSAAHGAGALPLLSHALLATWLRRERGGMTVAQYRATGGIHGSVAQTADAVLAGFTRPQRALARRLFLLLVNVAEHGADTRRRVPHEEVRALVGDDDAEDLDDVLATFIAAHLITAGADTVEITHEALLRAWPDLQTWVDADRAGLLMSQRLRDAATGWRREGRDPAALYTGGRLAVAREWAGAGRLAGLTPATREFLDASTAADRARQHLARRQTRRLQALVVVLSVLLTLTGIAGVIAVRSRAAATRERDIALSQRVAERAAELRAVSPALAVQLSLAAYRLAPTVEARSGLLSAYAAPYATRLDGYRDAVKAARFSADGRLLATAVADGTVELWGLGVTHRPARLAGLGHGSGAVYDVAFSPDGRTLATAGADHTARLWDIADPAHPAAAGTVTNPGGELYAVAFSPDGRILVTAGSGPEVRLWGIAATTGPAPVAVLTGHTGDVGSAAFSPDGRTLATAGADRTARLWDVSDPAHATSLGTAAGHADAVVDVAFSPNGRTLATASIDRTARLWNVADPGLPAPLSTLSGHDGGVVDVAFSPDGASVATAGQDRVARLWDIDDPTRPGHPFVLTGHTNGINSIAFSPDGRTVATAGGDRTVRLWDVPGPVLAGHGALVESAAFSPDGHTLATASYDTTARLWNVADPRRPALLATVRGHTDVVGSVAFSPDGRTLATAGVDGTARLWDVTDVHTPRPAAVLSGHTGAVYSVAFSPGGRILATAGVDHTARLWDVTDVHTPHAGAVLRGHTDAVYATTFSPDGRLLATAGFDTTARLWDVTAADHPAALATVTGHTAVVDDVAIAPDGKTLVTTSNDRTVRVWDIADPRNATPMAVLDGHADTVYSAAFSPDGRTLATTSRDNTARLWDITHRARPQPLAVLSGHDNTIAEAAFSPDGRFLVTASRDDTARLWSVDPTQVGAWVCAVAHPRITRAEWGLYFPNLAYLPPC